MPDATSSSPWQDRLASWGQRVRNYPGAVREGLGDNLHSSDTWVRWGTIGVLVLAGLMALVLVGWTVLLVRTPGTQSIQKTQLEQATIAYTADGEEITRYQVKNREWVPLDSISSNITEALLATEDHRFYKHNGVDVRRVFGSAWQTLRGNRQGGSTVSMQFARNAYPTIRDDFILLRKVKEWLTAIHMEDRYEKDEILEMYLNTVPFVYNAFGIEAAAQTYFQQSARDLGLLESATLIGMLKGTVYYNPVRHPERSRERRNLVLSQMVKYGYLDPAAYDTLRTKETPLNFKKPSRADNMAPHFAEYVRQWLDEWAEENGYNLYTDGLKVYTTLDSRLQTVAQNVARKVGGDLQAVADVEWSRRSSPYFSASASDYQSYRQRVQPFGYFWSAKPELLNRFIKQTPRYRRLTGEGLHADSAMAVLRTDTTFVDSLKTSMQHLDVGFMAMDPRNGHVRAWVGGRDFETSQYDHVAQAKRQPGSTFKPFVYITALELGFRSTDQLADTVITYRDPDTQQTWRPQNVGGASGNMMTLKEALAYSKNTITAQLVAEVGPHRVASTAHRLGIKSDLDEVPSIGLGTSPTTLMEMVAAYSTIANEGRYHEPIFVTRIENRNGHVLASFDTRARSVLSNYTAYTILDMMRGVVDYGTGQRIRNQYGIRGDFAGKTGTSQEGADGWFMLMHPNLVMGAWTGFSSPQVHFRSNFWGQGAHNALHVVGQFYRQANDEADVFADVSFQPPLGWEPPVPDTLGAYADSLYLAYGDSTYSDSLDALADSMVNATDSMLTADWGIEGLIDDEPAEEEDEPLTAADSLNRLEAADPQFNPVRSQPDSLRTPSRRSRRDSLPQSLPQRAPKPDSSRGML
ncbi:MAG TPA: PBP1A family penicillin-binding protein [Rhodothermales bacterium]|nr:PBP1A family penicillin-binding protein [Rhodothermales bacterium]